MLNKLFQRQLQKYFGDETLPDKFTGFFKIVSSSYDHYEQDRIMLERSIEISSEEMIELNQSQKKAHDELKTLFDNIEEVFFSVRYPDSHLLQMSPACERVYGRTIKDFQENSKLWYEVVLDEDKKIIDDEFPAIYTGNSIINQYRIYHNDGSIRWLETKITPTLNKEKILIRIDGVTSDITKRKNAEVAIAIGENKYRNLFEKMVDGVYKSSHEGKFIEVNPALVKMLGYDTKEELLAIDIKSQLYFNPDDRDEAIEQDNKDGLSIFRLRKKDGSAIWVEDRGQYISDEQGNLLYHEGILRDVTERINAQATILEANNNLKVSIERLDEAQQIAHLGSWVYDVRSKKGVRSSEFYKIFESSIDEFPNVMEDYLNFFHPDDRTLVVSNFNQVLKDHKPYQYQSRLLMKDGTVKFIQTNVKCQKDKNGELIKLYGTIQDISEQKKIQEKLEKNIDELTKSNSELDKFVYSVSHDLRAPLSSMLGIIEISQDETTDELMLESLNMLRGNIKKLDGFIADILDYSRNSRVEVKKEQIHFKELLNDITQNLKYMGGSNRKVDIKINVNDNVVVHSDKSRLSIILNNLVSNAIRYQNSQIPNPFVDIRIDTSDTETGIIIRDNGIGIDKENHQKIFDMFYRVSEESIGSGLGLYIVKETINKLQGHIEVESETGLGSTFKIKIPNN